MELAAVCCICPCASFASPKSVILTFPRRVEHDVAGLDIPVDDPLGVGVLETRADLVADGEGEVHRELFPPVEDIPEALAFDELHHHHVRSLVDAEIDDLHDVLVIERGGCFGLEDEAPGEVLVGGEVVVELLDGDDAVERGLDRPVQDGRPTGGDELEYLVLLGVRHGPFTSPASGAPPGKREVLPKVFCSGTTRCRTGCGGTRSSRSPRRARRRTRRGCCPAAGRCCPC